MSVNLNAFNPPVGRNVGFETTQKSDTRGSAGRVKLDRHHRTVLAGDLKLEEVATVNTRSYKQLFLLVEVALVD